MSATTQLDANQIIKKTYDDATGSVLVVQTYVDTTVWLNAVSAAADVTTSALNILPFKVTGVMAVWSGLNAVNGTLQFQGSLDQTTWDNIGTATTLSSASGHQSFALVDEPYKYVRLVYTHAGNSAGTLTVKYVMRA